MARYSWDIAFKTATMTRSANLPFIDGGASTSDGTASVGAGVITSKPALMLGQLVAVNRNTKIVTYLTDITAAAAVTFNTTDLYMIAEFIKPGKTQFVGYPIREKAHLNNLVLRTSADDLLGQYVATVMAGRDN